jgi:hypothetical protein
MRKSEPEGIGKFDIGPVFHGDKPFGDLLPVMVVDDKEGISRTDYPGKAAIGSKKLGNIIILNVKIEGDPR